MKRCFSCNTSKSLNEFWKDSSAKDGLNKRCNECARARSRKHHQNNSEKYNAKKREIKSKIQERNRQFVYEFLLKNPCIDCGISDIRLLQFDHISDKKSGVMQLVSKGLSLSLIEAEIRKCEVRCANCHVLKTYERLGGTWHDRYIQDFIETSDS